ncbi:MAG: hypothetical protein AB7O43_08075 [Hyphomicrobiaceae bacterium]
MRKAIAIVALGLVPLLSTGCGETEKPQNANATIEGVVQEAKVYTQRSKLFGETGRYYQIKIAVAGSRDWYANIGKGYVDEADLQRIIGQRITLGCFTDDPKITTCHHVVSLDHQGRNIIKR